MQPDKFEFLGKEVAYFGHIISEDGVKPNSQKIKTVKGFPIPKNQKKIKSFIGLPGYYRKFIKDCKIFSTIVEKRC